MSSIQTPSKRQQLSQREIDGVLRHYKIGSVHEVRELAEGSVYSPKVVINSERGMLLLKRRAHGLDLPGMVAFSHEIMIKCASKRFCVPPLLGTDEKNNSMVQFEDHVYELFAFIEGHPVPHDPNYSQNREHYAYESGVLLGELHRTLDSIHAEFEPVIEGPAINLNRLDLLQHPALGLDPKQREEIGKILKFGDEVHSANSPKQAYVHGDWHPGNMICSENEIVAVCDFDNTRLGSRPRECAQALIHCSLKEHEPSIPPQQIDPEPHLGAFRSFWQGYTQQDSPQSTKQLTQLVIGLIPAVMLDASLAMISGSQSEAEIHHARSALMAMARKAQWIHEHQTRLIDGLNRT